jgi:RNA polymerase sigma-70 factor (ECF subfamily)
VNGKPPAPDQASPESGADEAEWIAQLQQGDRQAFARIYERYRVRLYSFLVRLCGRRDQADDLLQDTFVQLARHATRLRPDTQLAPWLYPVARNRYLSQRRTAVSRLLQLRDFFLGATAAPSPLVGNPQQTASERQEVARLEAALQRLSPSLREVILLLVVEDFDQNQVAQMLGLQPAALRKRLERARAQLQWELSESEQGGSHGDS